MTSAKADLAIPRSARHSYRNTNTTGGLTIVLKLGTSSICDEKTYVPKLKELSALVETVVRLRSEGHRVVLVSSGAAAVGLKRLGLAKKPKHIPQVQAVAAVGQGRLMALYDSLFAQHEVAIAQVLLTRDNLADRGQYLNACNTFKELLNMDVVPIVNENDTVSHAEIRFGDNDTLSAITAGMINADYLFLLTDVDCLYTDNPRTNPDAKPVRVVEDVAKLKEEVTVTSPGSSVGTGGMVTKLIAADLAIAAGCSTIITLGSSPQNIVKILDEISMHRQTAPIGTPFNPTMGTHFIAKSDAAMIDRKWWILHGLTASGTLFLDAGAVRAVTQRHRGSLFAAGIVKVEGNFGAQQCVKVATVVRTVRKDDYTGESVESEEVVEIGRGIVNYTAAEIMRIRGHKSADIEGLLGYVDTACVIPRDNLAITNRAIDVETVTLQAAGASPKGSQAGSDGEGRAE
ncbi:hypothetical protein HK104_007044 [Borealophlyctis nickersoniae]|nr:hypothetical protein HK104_007044 [Borealophlyctis nickersoniae]